MIIDFRVRPPYGGFLNSGIMKRWMDIAADPRQRPATSYRRESVPSLENGGSMPLFMKEMDEAGIRTAVVMGRHNARPGDGFSNQKNDELKDLSEHYPGRFLCFAGIDPLETGAAEEVERCLGVMGFRGISLEPGWYSPALYADDPRLDDIYEICTAMGGIVSLTLSPHIGPDISHARPDAVQRACRRHPALNFVVMHACWPFFADIIGAAMFTPNLYLAPDCYFYVDDMPMADEMLKAANTFLKYQILFASSYPVRGLTQSVADWKRRGWHDDSLELSLYGNAARLLRL